MLAKVLLFVFSVTTNEKVATLRFETTMPYAECVEKLGPIIAYATPRISKMLHQKISIIGTCQEAGK